ncbi:HBL/NHE enterotoxin family protein [Spongiimicrobium salis]|uniref:HBL/NHE enterotoxin family protein n=1 Tax=Spongiimicrobium salis TaxID=1667022 RepID=UPI00374CB546
MTHKDPTMAPAKDQVSQGLTIQTYCNSVLTQPTVDFKKLPHLASFQKEINTGLATAQKHSNHYLNVIQPSIIKNISNIDNYYSLYGNVPIACPKGSSKKTWLGILKALQQAAITYEAESNGIVNELSTLNSNLGKDAATFTDIVTKLNAAVGGDNGVLKDLSSSADKIDGQIAGAISGTVLSGLAIVGGSFMIAVGGIADFVTAGTTTPLIVGGVAVLAVGIGGEVASAITLANLYKEKAALLQEKSSLKHEVNLALGISSAYSQMSNQLKSSMTAATQMKNAWGSLSADLGNMAADLHKGITSTDALRSLFLTGAHQTVPKIQSDIQTIKAQMAGVNVASTGNHNLGKFVEKFAHSHAA